MLVAKRPVTGIEDFRLFSRNGNFQTSFIERQDIAL